MALFSPSTSASNAATPRVRATSARWRKQKAGDAEPLIVLLDDECDFPALRDALARGGDEAPRRDDGLLRPRADSDEQHHVAYRIDGHDSVETGSRQLLPVREQAGIDRVAVEQPDRTGDLLAIVGTQRPDRHREPVAEALRSRVAAAVGRCPLGHAVRSNAGARPGVARRRRRARSATTSSRQPRRRPAGTSPGPGRPSRCA